MNIILDAPLTTSPASKNQFDDKILYSFLVFLVMLVTLGLLFVDLSKNLQKK